MTENTHINELIDQMKQGIKHLPLKCKSHPDEIVTNSMSANSTVMEYCTTCMNYYFRLKTNEERKQDQDFVKSLKEPMDF
ncbi:hypothetical protein KY314_00745 [Candidatus Woesearchaeota archaeon]|nr:hypothetical protein [Candidatus Woesearchaeota archaeon]